MGSYHQAMEFFEIDFNKKKYESLPKDLQAILAYAAEAASTSNYALAMDQYSTDLQELITKDKVKVIRTPADVFAAQLKSWDVIVKRLSDEDPFFKKVWESQKAWAKRVGYYGFINEADYKAAYEHLYGSLGF
jgi:TRAP-type mannitol/chloroaromatic compound transport system substrate-binding protein